MRAASRFALALCLIAAVVLVRTPAQAAPYPPAKTCAEFAVSGTMTMSSYLYDIVSLDTNDVVTFSFTLHPGTTSAQIRVQTPSGIHGPVYFPSEKGLPAPASWTYTMAAPGTMIFVWVFVAYGGAPDNTKQVDYNITCSPASAVPPTSPVPGPDMVAIPEGAAMGTFLVDTPLYFAPDALAVAPYLMKAGQSLWVFGMSTDGAFYQVVLAGSKAWVPVGVIGPTNGGWWHNDPLPTTVVN